MIKEITKTITEKVTVCDICEEPATYMCAVCGNAICITHMLVIQGYNNSVYICSQCNEKPFSEIWAKLYSFLNTTTNIYPYIQYQYKYQWKYPDTSETGDYWVLPTYITSGAAYTKE